MERVTLFPRGKGKESSNEPKKGVKRALSSSEETLFGAASKRLKKIETVSSKKKVKKESASPAVAPSLGLGSALAVQRKNKKFHKVANLSLNKVVPGSYVLGVVLSVFADSALISLTNGFLGMAKLADMVDPSVASEVSRANRVITQRQVVRCCVLENSAGSRHLSVSLRCAVVNRNLALKHLQKGMSLTVSVVSKEDHGCIVSAGMGGTSFFLPEKEAAKFDGELNVGRILNCIIDEVNREARTVSVKHDNEARLEEPVKNAHLPFMAVMVGMLFDVVVDKIVENGLFVNYLNLFHGTVDLKSLPISVQQLQASDEKGQSWKAGFQVGQILQARVVFVDHGARSVHLSLRPHILMLRGPLGLPPLGDLVHHLVVRSVLPQTGLILTIQSVEEEQPVEDDQIEEEQGEDGEEANEGDGKKRLSRKERRELKVAKLRRVEQISTFLITKANLAGKNASVENKNEDDEETLGQYRVGNVLDAARVKGYHLVEGLVAVSNKSAFLSAPPVHLSQLKLGQCHEVTVLKVLDHGLALKVGGEHVDAFCPAEHAGEVPLLSGAQLAKRFREGQRLNMRVWELRGTSVYMTNKKSLLALKEDEAVLAAEEAKKGQRSAAIVLDVTPEGVHVRFFGKARGILPIEVLTKQSILDPAESFRRGEVVRVVVLAKSKPKGKGKGKKNLLLALDLNLDENSLQQLEKVVVKEEEEKKEEQEEGKEEEEKELEEGFVAGTVYKVEKDGETISVRLDDGRSATTSKNHFFDLASTANEVFASADCPIKSGYRVPRAIILSSQESHLFITMKPLLLYAAAKSKTKSKDATESNSASEEVILPAHAADLSPGQIVVGYVYKVESYGVLVRFAEMLTALAPRPNLADRFLGSAQGHFHAGDSMRCMVQRVDLTKSRIFVTFKPSLLTPSVQTLPSPVHYLAAWFRERFQIAGMQAKEQEKLLPSWETYPIGSVVKATVTSVESFGLVLLGADQTTVMLSSSISGAKVGQEVRVLILDVDLEHFVLQVIVLESGKKKSRGEKKERAHHHTGERLQLEVALLKQNYVVAVDRETATVAFIALADFHQPEPGSSDLQIGSIATVEIISAPVEKKKKREVGSFPHEKLLWVRLLQDGANDLRKRVQEEDQEEAEESLTLKEKLARRLKIGSRGKWTIQSVSAKEVRLSAVGLDGEKVEGRIDISSAPLPSHKDSSSYDSLKEQLQSVAHGSAREGLHPLHPFAHLVIGKTVWCQVLQVRGLSSEGDDEIENEGNDQKDEGSAGTIHVWLQLSVKDEGGPVPRLLQLHGRDGVHRGHWTRAVVTGMDAKGCYLALSPYVNVRMPLVDVSRDEQLLESFRANSFVGLSLYVVVVQAAHVHRKSNKICVSRAMIEPLLNSNGSSSCDLLNYKDKAMVHYLSQQEEKQFAKGNVLYGCVQLKTSTFRPPAFAMQLPAGRQGRICATELAEPSEWSDLTSFFSSSNSADSKLPNGVKDGAILRCCVLSSKQREQDEENSVVELSLRPSRLEQSDVQDDAAPRPGALVRGFVVSVGAKGCFVRLSRGVTGRVLVKDLADHFVEQPDKLFHCGQLVQARVRSVNGDKIALSLRASEVLGKAEASSQLANLQEGDVLKGVVERVNNDIGVFVQLSNTVVVGLARKEQAVHDSRPLSEVFAVGDIVRAKILHISRESGKVALGLTENFFRSASSAQPISLPAPVDDIGEVEDEPTSKDVKKRGRSDSDAVDTKAKSQKTSASRKEVKTTESLDDEDEDDIGPIDWGDKSLPASSKHVDSSSDSDEEEEQEDGRSKLRSKQKEALRKKEEQAIREKERALAEGSLVPRQAEDFERLLLEEPNSSMLWVQYIAYYVNSADIEAARLLAQRALRSIHFRELKEKFNVWMAWLNLEYKYGSKDSLEQTLQQALVESKGKDIYLALAHTFEQAADFKSAEALLLKALKKPQYKKSKKVWMELQRLQLRAGQFEAARSSLTRSLQSLSKHKHVETISRFALAEFEFGSADKARQLFEDLLEAFPKRTDLWHLYVDREVKMGNLQQARQLFERMIASKSNTRNMKTVFKKYLALEMRFGDEVSQQAVKEKAADYVNSLA